MSTWREFLSYLELPGKNKEKKPGPVLISFLNRYLEALDSIKYQIEFDGRTITGVTTQARHTVQIRPLSSGPIKIYVWSRVREEFKLVNEINPIPGERLLINQRMKTYKHKSETQLHPDISKESTSSSNGIAKSALKANSVVPGQKTQGVEAIKTKNKNSEPEHQTNRNITEKIQVIQLKNIFPAAEEAYLSQVADELNHDLKKYKLDTIMRRAHFFAQARQETGAKFSPKEENLNYRPAILASKFSYYGKAPDEANQDGRLEKVETVEKVFKKSKKEVKVLTVVQQADQEAIANKAYGGRGENGPPSTGDGWKFRGRGIFQLTLRSNYVAFTKEYPEYWNDGVVDFAEYPDKICEFPYFIRSAVWYWVKNKAFLNADGGANDASVDAITRIVNGPAMDAAAERRKNFHELTYPAFK